MTHPETLLLKKGGVLQTKRYSRGAWRTKDLTKVAFRCLYEECSLAEDVTLRDVFLLLNKNLKMFDLILGCWCKEVVTAGLSKRHKRNLKTDDIDYLELYYHIVRDEYPKDDKRTYGLRFPEFHGVGKLKKDSEDGHGKKGETIQWGVSLSEPWKLAPLPLKLNNEGKVFLEKRKSSEVITTLPNPVYTLGNILQGIMWELSWHGSPEQVQKFAAELHRRVEEVESGKAKLVQFDPKKLLKEVKASKGKKK